MMKFLLTTGAVGFLCAAFLDPLWASGLNRPIPWIRDGVMAFIGVACFYLLAKFRNEL
ncbi:MAG: hypothetical protein AB9919_02865 [Geobacteraceae bacterium]